MGKLKVGASSPAAGHTPPAFSAGARCRILGLKTAKQHNGVDAVMLEQQGERVLVKTQNSDELRVKPENLSELHECSYCGNYTRHADASDSDHTGALARPQPATRAVLAPLPPPSALG